MAPNNPTSPPSAQQATGMPALASATVLGAGKQARAAAAAKLQRTHAHVQLDTTVICKYVEQAIRITPDLPDI